MAKVEWTRDPSPTPPARFTISLSEAEARTLRLYLSIGGEGISLFRLQNPSVYDLSNALRHALQAAAETQATA